MAAMVNSKWTLARRPEGVYDPALDTTLVTEQVSLEEMKSLVDPNCTRPGGRGTAPM